MNAINKFSLKGFCMLLLFCICILCFAGCSKQGDYVVGSFNPDIRNFDWNDDGKYDSTNAYLEFEIKPNERVYRIEYSYDFFDADGNSLETKLESRDINGNSKNNIGIANDYHDLNGSIKIVELNDIKFYYTTEWLYGLFGGIAAGALLTLAIVIFVKSKRKETGK